MTQQPTTILSNRLESLYCRLRQTLFSEGSSPFARRVVIVPSPAIRTWLQLQLASDPSLGIAAGVQVFFLNDGLAHLYAEFLKKEEASASAVPSLQELALAIEVELAEILRGSEAECVPWRTLSSYLRSTGGELAHRDRKRLLALADELASLFGTYGEYAGDLVAGWEKAFSEKSELDWQEELWCRIYRKNPRWTYPYRQLLSLKEETFSTRNNLQIHLFAFSFISKLHQTFFDRLASAVPTAHYLLSPSQGFWGDFLSSKEKRSLHRYWEKKGVSEDQQGALDIYLREHNPLLANLGRLGREMASLIEGGDSSLIEEYAISPSVATIPQYQELLSEEFVVEHSKPLALLDAVQADLLLLRNIGGAPLAIPSADRSIQLHIVHSRLREIQVLYDTLLGLIDKHQSDVSPITPAGILVMAPNIEDYEPLIQMVFGDNRSQLSYQLADLQICSHSAVLGGFWMLLDLASSRWDPLSLLKLFDLPLFQARQRIDPRGVEKLRLWVKETGVRWGEDAGHRGELLQRANCPHSMADQGGCGTWEQGLSELIQGLSTVAVDESSQQVVAVGIESSEGELLGKWIKLIRSLREDLQPLADGTSMGFSDWILYLQCLFEAYFTVDSDDKDAVADKERLYAVLQRLKSFAEQVEGVAEAKFTFDTLRHHLQKSLGDTRGVNEHQLHAVRFCSMLPMRAIPAQVVCLLGMDEGSYPRRERESALNRMRRAANVDYCPTRSDFDRYLFLEAILSARGYLLISYVGHSFADGLEVPPSLLVTEFLDYLDKGYRIDEDQVSTAITIRHPFFPFDKRYFLAGDPLPKSYSCQQFLAAQACYGESRSPPHRLFSDFFIAREPSSSDSPEPSLIENTVEIRDLANLARNPLKTFCNKTLGIYLDSPEDRKMEIHEALVLSNLDSSSMKKEAYTQPLSEVLERARRRSRLPMGLFGQVAVKRLDEEVEELHGNLKKMGIAPSDFFDVELSASCTKAEQVGRTQWIVPALRIEPPGSSPIAIIGKLTHLTGEGLLVHAEDSAPDILKEWPRYLVASCLSKQTDLVLGSKLLLGKSGGIKLPFFEDPAQLLAAYLEYYFQARQRVSPLLPQWVEPIVKGELEELDAKVKQALESPWSHVFNDYLKWSLRSPGTLDVEQIFRPWSARAQALYGPLFEHWLTKKKGEKA